MASKFFESISNYSILLFIFILAFTKIIIYILFTSGSIGIYVGGGSDAETYDAYANGYTNLAPNIWPIILRYLNGIGLYSREVIAYLLFFSSLVAIPIISCRIASLNFKRNQKYYLYLFLICTVYPTLYYYTFDIYRDVFMVLVFLISCLVVRRYLNSNQFLISSFYFILLVLFSVLLFNLRPYLGLSFFVSLFLWKIKFTKNKFLFYSIIYLISLLGAHYLGLLDKLVEYRTGFEEVGGGSTMGLDFSNPVSFIPNLFLSVVGQLFGLYITNPLAVLMFIIESIPVVLMIKYIITNIRLADDFLRFLIIFFIIYASIWLIGNDNLGTALRLRFYNYFVVYICFFYILRTKKQLSSNQTKVE